MVVSVSAIYSDSMVDKVTVICLCELKEIYLLMRIKVYPEVDFELFRSVENEVSENPLKIIV